MQSVVLCSTIMAPKKELKSTVIRPPVVAIMGHIDHGKSTLLDYIRKSNVVAGEAGGITQHISAYEVEHNGKKITFLDTPGHEAFAATRSRGASIADIAVLVVSAEDGVKAQTMGAFEFIQESKIPYVVAITKIDSPKADAERAKYSLVEKGIYLEGMGGSISFSEVSAKTGKNIDELLDTILLTAELENFEGDPSVPATGFVLESSMDSKKGISATLIIKNGTIKQGNVVVIQTAHAPVRLMENFGGQTIKEASFSSPVKVIGFDSLPEAGSEFQVFENKKDALQVITKLKELKGSPKQHADSFVPSDMETIPLVIKADVAGSLDAIVHQINKFETTTAKYKIVSQGVGEITDGDVKTAGNTADAVIVGFHVKASRQAADVAEKLGMEIKLFTIIYELTDFLEAALEKRRTRVTKEEEMGLMKVVRVFSWTNKGGVLGGKVQEGNIKINDSLAIIRRDVEIGRAVVKGLQRAKQEVTELKEGDECGMMISSKYEIAEGDRLKAIRKITI